MKRSQTSRNELSIHEAGHLLATTMLPDLEPGDFEWRRLRHYEIAHVEPSPLKAFDWEVHGP